MASFDWVPLEHTFLLQRKGAFYKPRFFDFFVVEYAVKEVDTIGNIQTRDDYTK